MPPHHSVNGAPSAALSYGAPDAVTRQLVAAVFVSFVTENSAKFHVIFAKLQVVNCTADTCVPLRTAKQWFMFASHALLSELEVVCHAAVGVGAAAVVFAYCVDV